MMAEIKHMDIAEFCREGYLQELNRNFLHPLGLALEVTVEEDGSEHISGVWDYRDDPEGIYFADPSLDQDRADHITKLWMDRFPEREERLGFMVQPIEWEFRNG